MLIKIGICLKFSFPVLLQTKTPHKVLTILSIPYSFVSVVKPGVRVRVRGDLGEGGGELSSKEQLDSFCLTHTFTEQSVCTVLCGAQSCKGTLACVAWWRAMAVPG